MTLPLYILAFRQRDALTALAAEGGRPVVASRQGDDAARRFAASGAMVAVVDLRGAWDDGFAAVAALASPVAEREAALVVLVSRSDLTRLAELRAAGATHFLASPFAEEEFRQTLRFAEASVDRRADGVRGGGDAPLAGQQLRGFLGRDLERALTADEIEILFQPQVALTTGRIVGVEALMRWQHPQLGEQGAEALLDAADRAGLAVVLSGHVQDRALAIAAAWPGTLSQLRLSINVTATDLAEPGFLATMLRRVDDSGFPRDRLTVEITERGVIEDTARAAALLAGLRAGGLKVAIDDFGTGYSSLAYLSQLPLDYLKLDRALTREITGSARDRVVVRGAITMAHSLGLAVIAEGVETAAQRDQLARESCELYQGFLCAPPLAATTLASLVGEGGRW